MDFQHLKSRRIFLRIAGAGIALFFAFLWNKLTLHHLETVGQKSRVLPFNKNKVVSFVDGYIIVNQDNSTKVYSAQCTHLGCKIDKMEGDRFVCPCHGSQYDLNGNVLKGPAYKSLRTVSATVSDDGSNIEIKA